MARKNKHEYYMEIAEKVKERSTCTTEVGAVLVGEDGRILSVGYNGAISGAPHCIDSSCLRVEGNCIRTVHAEINALLYSETIDDNMTMYTTLQPCVNCFKAVFQAGVTDLYFKETWEDKAREELFKELRSNNMVVKDRIRNFGHYHFTKDPEYSIPGFTSYSASGTGDLY